ncbi:diguanylate cyclase (GGDEF)-like protein/PAS domain S-box-containing protein/putative nucleotidyltransferase with HDIG domain [Acetoanaerobium pronyense]|uniref:Diguanylate cyclase (GGDEF)-like protein/PAS domain S-box-containing protein/putative nucleotidyltransferase with HDIG domain n=1 Tax=Acetoanaerobium pronyense TaxID=1482736 RepID=A0ABS4KLQ1_9FIRM|nr:diguanylate cyclase (GGDEF)-like protein/PAS domain S-box-containing protein/putative nucleotidyltransferase with HDIG domain [Acetoanaerobium pronyense]
MEFIENLNNLSFDEKMHRLLFENSPDAIAYLDERHFIIQVNQAFVNLFGYKKEECVGKNLDIIVSGIHNERTLKEAADTTKELFRRGMMDIHGIRYSKNGNPLYVNVRGILSKENGVVTGGYAIYTDVSRAKKHEFELAEKNIELEAALNQLKATEEELRENFESLLKSQQELEYITYHDKLTGIYNRLYFEKKFKELDCESNLPLAVIISDVNGLKLANDAFGTNEGDKILQKVANIIKTSIEKDSIVARLGGDEFAILLPNADNLYIEKMVENMKKKISKKDFSNIEITLTFGWNVKINKEEDLNEILKSAEDRMYRKKLFENPSVRAKTVSAIIKTLHEKNKREEAHSHRVSELCEKMGTVLGLSYDNIKELKVMGLLHDIGKIAIEESILNKSGSLSEQEWKEIKKHPEIGFRILSSVSEMSEMARYVLAHHERIDGSGYPRGLKGNEIPLQSKIISIVDTYDAITSQRSYREAMTNEYAVSELLKGAGTQFDKELVDIFVKKVLCYSF